MILLKATTETLAIITTTTGAIDYSISYADITTSTFAPSTSEGKIITGTTTTVLTAPAGSTQRQVKLIAITNRDPSVTNTIQVQKLISATAYDLTPVVTLLAGQSMQYMDGVGWTYYSVTGSPMQTGIAGGSTNQIQYNSSGSFAGSPNLVWDNTSGTVNIGQGTELPSSPLTMSGNINSTVQSNIQNINAGTSASGDYVATADTGSNTANYVDLGINSSVYSDSGYTISGPLDSYLYSNGGNLTIGTQTDPKTIKFHTGGTLAANLRATISDTGLDIVSGLNNANIPNGINNGNSSAWSQALVAATNYYVAGSALTMPATPKAGMVVGTRFIWRVAMTKTAAGTGAFNIKIYRGTLGTTGDTPDVTQSIGTQTAALDNMIVDVEITVTATGASGSYYWSIIPNNKAASATGFGVTTGTAAYFSGTVTGVAMNTASLIFGLGFYCTLGTPTLTIPHVNGQVFNMT